MWIIDLLHGVLEELEELLDVPEHSVELLLFVVLLLFLEPDVLVLLVELEDFEVEGLQKSSPPLPFLISPSK
jgi:hypothetical protein